MIKLICNNPLISKTVTSYLSYKNFLLSSNDGKWQTVIKIYDTDKSIILDINGERVELAIPVDINLLVSQTLKKIINIYYLINNYKYYPFQRVIRNHNKKSFLSDIQNLIMITLLTSSEGIDKDLLYKTIWKKDKSIHINKLDTHLTNLKKKLKLELGIKINFQSHKKNLRLLID